MRHKASCCIVITRRFAAILGAVCASWLAAPHAVRAQVASPTTPVASSYTSIVIFGDSLTDTGNDATVSSALYTVNAQVPGPATGYTNGRFTDGTDTLPAARNYKGVWAEQLAARLTTHPTILNSLAGGTNYAYGFATTDVGTSAFDYGPSNALVFNVNNMGLQLSTFLATKPTINNKTLFIVWGGANDLIAAVTSADIVNAASRDVALVQQLINAGATDFIVPNLPPLGLVPRYNGSAATAAQVTGAVQGFDQALAYGLSTLAAANPGKTLHIYSLDTYTLFNTIVASPSVFGFANVTASSQANSAVNPDTYLFWDDLHPTTFGHSLIANSAATLLGTPIATSAVVTPSTYASNLNASVTLTANVIGTSGSPMGTVTFLDGTNTLSTGVVTGASSTTSASFTTSTLAAGAHTITASFSGVNGYLSSTSSAINVQVIPPSFQAALAASSINLARGSSTSVGIGVAAYGGYTGTFTVACGALPAKFTCAPATTSITVNSAFTGTSVTIGAAAQSAELAPHSLHGNAGSIALAVLGFPFLLFAGIRGRSKRGRLSLASLALIVFSSVGAFTMSGCGSDPYANDPATGSYSIPIILTPATGAATTLTLTVVVQ